MLEQVRLWRNADHVRLRFEHQELIDAKSHLNWFRNLDLRTNHYFVISVGEEAIGVAHIKDIDWELDEGEAGVFIGEEAWLGRPEPAQAVVKLMKWAYTGLGLGSLVAKVKSNEEKVMRFNLQLGYQLVGEPTETGFQRLRCTKEDYERMAAKWRF